MNNEQLKTKKLEDIFPKVNVIDNLVSDNTETPLSAKQGKVLKDIIQTNKDDIDGTIQNINGRINFLNDLTAIHSGDITAIGTSIKDINEHLTTINGDVDDIREDVVDINNKLVDKNSIKDLGYFRLDDEAFAKASERSITENLDICFIVWKTDSTNGIIYQQRKSLYYVKQVLFFVGSCECKLRLITTGGNYHVGEWQNFNVLIRPEFDNQGWLIDRGPVNSGGFGPFPIKKIAQLQLANNTDGSIGAINNKQYNKIAQMDMSDGAKITGDCTTLLGRKGGVNGGSEAIRIGCATLIEEYVHIGSNTNIDFNVHIGTNAVIHQDAVIGSNTFIDKGVHIINPTQVDGADIESTDLTIYPGAAIGTNFIQTTNEDGTVNRIRFKGQNNYIEKCDISDVSIGKLFDPNENHSVIIGEQVNINDTVNIGSNVSIDGYTTIGSHTTIGNEAYIHDYVYIGSGVVIGADSDVDINGGVTLGGDISIKDNVYIGSDTYIHDDVLIGSTTYGNVVDIRPYSSIITKGVYIGSGLDSTNAIIGSDYSVYIGTNIRIHSDVMLEDNIKIGKNVIIGTGDDSVKVRVSKYSNYISERVYIGTNIEIGSAFADNDYVHIGWAVDISDNVTIGSNVCIKKDITINDGAVIGTDVKIGTKTNIGESVTIGNNLVIGNNSIIGNNAVIGNKAVIADESKLLKNVIIGTDSTNTPNMISIDNYNGPVDIKGSVYISTNVNIGYDTNIGNNATLPNNFNVSIENDKLKLVIGEKTLYLSFEEQPQTNNV